VSASRQLQTHPSRRQLCDDSFEEHVLPYPPEKSGLHLHGINRSIKAFSTLLPTEVDAFADEWGFTKTPTIALDTVEQVRIFTDEVGKTGKWNGEPLEGFVVRTHVAETQDFLDTKSRPPYPPGSTFFFKVKFDEPYMMYRDWREVTKTLLSANAKGSLSLAQLPKSKLKRPETQLYVKWVKEEIKKDPAVFKEYNKGKGIIRTRERFLAWMSGEGGKGTDAPAAQNEEKGEITTGRAFGKTIIAPVAVPGCGTLSQTCIASHHG
jgi:tRNA ligase